MLHPLIKKAIKENRAVAESWSGLAKKIFDDSHGLHQRQEMKKAYYWGFYAAFDLCLMLGKEIEDETEQGKALQSIEKEARLMIESFGIPFKDLKQP